jgi:hypothetical protein
MLRRRDHLVAPDEEDPRRRRGLSRRRSGRRRGRADDGHAGQGRRTRRRPRRRSGAHRGVLDERRNEPELTAYDLTGLIVIALGVWRVWRILSTDTVLDWPRDRLLGTTKLASGVTHYRRDKLAEFVGCPWCFGWWLVLGAFAAWHWWSKDNTVLIAVPFAMSTGVGLLTQLD